jgi:ring-1,2-phenylacetyl-CoA epoxidase subunit PaaD
VNAAAADAAPAAAKSHDLAPPPACASVAADEEMDRRLSRAWLALASVEDPEIPALSIVDLGLIRYVTPQPDGILEVGLSPT